MFILIILKVLKMLSNKLIASLFKNRLFNNLLRKNLTTEFDSRIFSLDPSEGLDSDQKEIYSMASKFAKTKMRPFMAEWDKNGKKIINSRRE